VGFMDKLFGKKEEFDGKAISMQAFYGPRVTKANLKEPLTPKQNELLPYLTRHALVEGNTEGWEWQVGPLKDNINFFIKAGLLNEGAPIEARFNEGYSVASLKKLCKLYGVAFKPKDKKAEIIGALVAALPQDQAEELVRDIKLYSLTEKGGELVRQYKARGQSSSPGLSAKIKVELKPEGFQEEDAIVRGYRVSTTAGHVHESEFVPEDIILFDPDQEN
jgi:hypothetical protein